MNEICGNRLVLGVVLHTLEAHEGTGANGMTWDSRGEAYVDAVGLARGRSHAIPPWPDQEAYEANDWVAKSGDIYVEAKEWHRCS